VIRDQPVSGDRIPLLWLCGPPGVGKTAVGWLIFSQLTSAGTASAYVDIDQLGICVPELASDPGRYRMKAENLGAVVANFRAAGLRCITVSGVVDPANGVPREVIPHTSLTVCRLRADRDELVRRLVGRRGEIDLIEAVLREAEALDAGEFADVTIDTTGLPVADVASLVRARSGGWPGLTGPGHSSALSEGAESTPSAAGGPVLWLCGARGAGKSTVGWEIFQAVSRAGSPAAFVDLDQLGFCGPAPTDDPGNHRVRARNLAAVWGTYRAAGAQCLVVVGPVEDETAVKVYTDALPAAAVTLCRLHAGRDQLTRQVMLRGQGGSWSAPGDPLTGRPTAYLIQVAEEAVAAAAALERAAMGDLRIEIDGRSVAEIAVAIIALAGGWPGKLAQAQ
jgi:adenylylsulfate kinase-like enzyme